MADILNEDYWTNRYHENRTGWDIGFVSRPIKEYVDQLKNKDQKILIPGGGFGYEAEYLHRQGFKSVFALDVSGFPLKALAKRYPIFPKSQLLKEDFFGHEGSYDMIIEQTFFCALNTNLRPKYVDKMHALLKPEGKLFGVLFNHPLTEKGPPYGGNLESYRSLFEKRFDVEIMADCYNSIGPRMGNEFFIKLVKH